MLKNKIGENAGIIWQQFTDKNEISFKELQKKSGLKKDEFLMAIGWLAREGKIYFNEDEKNSSILWID